MESGADQKRMLSPSAGGGAPNSSIADELFGGYGGTELQDGCSSWNAIFPPASTVMKSYAKQQGFKWEPRATGGGGSSRSNGALPARATKAAPEEKEQRSGGGATRAAWKEHNKIGKGSEAAMESPHFGSSVYYGGREFYGSSASKDDAGATEFDYSDDKDLATRGNWWKGSLYY